ncbi:MAG: insulinase family protein [Bacteroidetes bacterium]|nr:insulinase family protein [Bacteroidota bacterium]
MKKIFFLKIMALLLFAQVVNGQEDFRKAAPKPGPAPKIELGKAEQFTLKNGLKVILVENHKLPRVSFQVFVDVPPMLEGEMVGYRDLAGQLLSKGTTTRSKSQIDQAIDFMGASLTSNANGVTGSCLTKHKGKLLDVMTDVLLNPTFPAEEFEKAKKQTLSGLAQAKDDPNQIAENVSAVLRNGKLHPYGEVASEKSIDKISVDNCRDYYQQYFKPNISYLIVTGDITVKEVKTIAPNYFDKWAKAEVAKSPFDLPKKPAATQVDFVHKTGAVQSVINVTYPVELKPGTDDVIKVSVMNTLLGGYFGSRLNENLREGKAYTYGARSVLNTDPVVGYFNAYASVRNEVTDSSVVEFLHELNKLRDEVVAEEELSMVKNVMTGSFARSLESPETVARFALNTARYNLPSDYYATYLQKLSQVGAADIKMMAGKYLTPANAHILVVGNKEDVAEKLARFSSENKVDYWDVYGNPIEQAGLAIPGGVTAGSVLADYLTAIGGKNLNDIKSVNIQMTTNLQGMEMATELNHMAPNKLEMLNSMMGNVLMESVFDGEKGVNIQMGQKRMMEGAALSDMNIDGHLFPERFYEKLGVKVELKGMELIDGKKAYQIAIEYPSGSKKTHYFDVETSLKVKEIEDKEGTTVTNDISDYKEVNGIKFPHTVTITGLAPMPLTMTTKSVTVNGEMDTSLFIIE